MHAGRRPFVWHARQRNCRARRCNCNTQQDQSLRLWNVRTRVCVLIMTGEGGHRNEVLSIVRPCLL